MNTKPPMRKRLEFEAETWHALQFLGRDTMKSLQELAEEAFRDLLRKHRRPVSLKEALRESTRRHPANDDVVPESKPKARKK